MILEGMVFRYIESPSYTIRIIYIDDTEHVYYVTLYISTSMPKVKNYDEFNDEVNNQKVVRITDPYIFSNTEEELTEKQKQDRDYKWNIVNKYWQKDKNLLLSNGPRNMLFRKIADENQVPLLNIQRLFSRFWQRGMNKNAFVSDYKYSGGRGKEKKLGDKKTGRPKNSSYYTDELEGINITEDIKKLFKIAIKKYYLNNKNATIKDVYIYLLRDYFSDKYNENGIEKYRVWDKNHIPTYEQFCYWLNKLTDKKNTIIARKGKKQFELENRPTTSNSTLESNGPGVRFQIDATIADVYLVSSLCRDRIIGRPIVYAIIDVFSRMVMGMYVGLEGPSWMGAMMALDNMVSDKVEYCAKYGINISKEEWDVHYLPDIIIADRGEFEGYSVENLINNMNIKVENTPPYRGDLKGIVERRFRTINGTIKHKSPGAIQKEYRKRGDRDYRLDAVLSLEEFTAMMIRLVIYHNNSIVDKYPMESIMITEKVKPIPVELWNWGIINKRGHLREVNRDIFKLNILPRSKATISRAGIKFKNLFYGSKKAMEEQLFINPKNKKVEIVYDPRNMNYIYIPIDYNNTFEKCYLLSPSLQYKDCILEEIIFNQELVSELKSENINNQNQKDIDINQQLDEIIKKAAKAKKDEPSIPQSNNKKIKGIRMNRTVEKEINREDEAFELDKKEKTKESKVIVIKDSDYDDEQNDKNSNTNNRLMDKLRRKRNEYREK